MTMAAATLPLTAPDLVCENDLDQFARETTSDLQTLEQDVLHLLVEPLGSNLDDPTRGVGLPQRLSGTSVDLAAAPKAIDEQLAKDPRIVGSTSKLSLQPDGSYRIDIQVQATAAVVGLSFSYTAANGLGPA